MKQIDLLIEADVLTLTWRTPATRKCRDRTLYVQF